MKIAFLNIYQNKVNRGAETFIKELSKRLVKNHEVDIISDVNFLKLYRQNYDVVIPTNGRVQVLIVRVITWLRGSKMIVSGHSGPGFDDRINLLAFPDAFVGLTRFQSTWARKVNPLVKVYRIPNGVDLDNFVPTTKPISVDLPKPIFLSVGALDSNKRLDLTIKAVSKLKEGSLLIVGKGAEEENLQALGNKLLPGRFKIISFLYHKMPQVYAAADIFTYPTVPWESFGLAMLEAMATNLPVVATSDPIRHEIVNRAGIFVDPTNTQVYTKALELALKMKWGKKPRRQAEKFNWDKIALEYEKLFKEIV